MAKPITAAKIRKSGQGKVLATQQEVLSSSMGPAPKPPTGKQSARSEERTWAGQQRRQSRRMDRRAGRQERRSAAMTPHVMPTKANSGKALSQKQTQVSSGMSSLPQKQTQVSSGMSSASSMVKQPMPMTQPRSPAAKRGVGQPASSVSVPSVQVMDPHKLGYTKL